MAQAVAGMGEIDEVHSNDEGVVVNGDIGDQTKEPVMESHDVEMENDTVNTSNDDVEMESRDDATSQSGIDDDSQDSQTSQDATSQSSQDSNDQDSIIEPQNDATENGNCAAGDVTEDTNSSVPQQEVNENSNVSSTQEEDSRSSEGRCDSTSQVNESSQSEESDRKSQMEVDEEDVSRDGSAAKSEPTIKATSSENGSVSAKSNDQVHEVKESDNNENSKAPDTIELNSEDEEDDVLILDSKPNGSTEVIDLVDNTPEKKPVKLPETKAISIIPRRSSRNLNKSKSYTEADKEPQVSRGRTNATVQESDESDVEEVMPQDPLAVNDQITVERIPSVKKPTENAATIVVKDTKRLVEIATKSNQNSSNQSGKKEPTLVIIDTNSILSGKGRGGVQVTSKSQSLSNSNFASVLPVAVPAQGLYPPNMKATITPIPMTAKTTSAGMSSSTVQQAAVPPLLPTLTDDMFVVEAPSFIVPYVYEKPPVKVLKEFVTDIKKQMDEEKTKAKKETDQNEKKDSEKWSSDEDSEEEKQETDTKKPYSYFESPLGKFFIDIGLNMVQEYVQSDLLKQQKRKRDREQGSNPETNKTIASLMKNIEMSKGNNEHFKMDIKKCEFCNFKTESNLAMAYHLETPHVKNFVYKCNFCSYEVRSPHDILFHMEAEHAVRGHLERAPAFHQCPSCPFEDNQKGKLSRHLVVCARKFKPDRNLEPPPDWEPPAKIPRMPKMRATGLNATVAAYQTLAANKGTQYQFLSKTTQGSQHTVKKPTNTPSISITPLPRGTTATPSASKPGDTSSKNSFVICEICDGYIKDLEQLRNHMQWIHKIKIHPKMIYNRPPLNCQKCQFRFFTDQGLERHLLGSHGLVTSSMQDAANKSKDSGRCPVCGRVYQWKLLNHVARDHNMTLKPAHLSYKCTVCTATFGMYKQFENHVYSAHSVVAKRVMDKKSSTSGPSPSPKNTEMKPLKINDEITIIPQPAKSTNGAKETSPAPKNAAGSSKSR
ncbi:hypothetical protein ABEB36_001333 [Hypothenemus hampei]|uniref:MOG interacting and ectopic P-granules protein 1 n=1 Tax=Hypothenemus hampei TaxID=57062 RepID=A0ABD1FE74_HYPHA